MIVFRRQRRVSWRRGGGKALVRRTNTERRKTGHQRTAGRGPLDVALAGEREREKKERRWTFSTLERTTWRGDPSSFRVSSKQGMERFFDSTSSSIDFSFSFRVVVRRFVNSLCARVNSSGTGGRGDSSRCFSDEWNFRNGINWSARCSLEIMDVNLILEVEHKINLFRSRSRNVKKCILR